MASWKTATAVLLFVLLLPALARAQGSGISGTVTDTTGGVLPGVTVEARSPALIEQVRTAITDGAGQYQVVELRPGAYTVTFTLPGFTTVVREGIELTTGFTANVDVQLRVGSVEETITVTGATPVVDVQNVTNRQVATRDVMDTVPVAKSFQSLGVLIPGIVTAGVTGGVPQDVGGQSGNNHMTMAIHGGRTGDQHLQVDGLSMEAFTREDSTNIWLPDANFQEYAFDYSANSADTETGGVRVNMIPREGANRFSAGAFYNLATEGMQASNVDDDLIARGLRDPNRVTEIWNLNTTLGGPITQDRLWFLLTHSRFVADGYEAGIYYNKDVRAPVYVPDLSRQGVHEQEGFQSSLRLTWQATPRNKVTAYWVNGEQCHCHWQIGGGTTRNMPEASTRAEFGDQVYQAGWTSPVTSRLLFEAGASSAPQTMNWPTQPYGAPDLPGILELANPAAGRIQFRNKGSSNELHYGQTNKSFRGSMSYVTGSHATKVGFTVTAGTQHQFTNNQTKMAYQTLRGIPTQVTFYAYPLLRSDSLNPNLGIYAQDQWTVDRLTVNAGVRFDYFRSGYPDHHHLPSQFVPVARIFEGQTVVTWKDLSPRLGAAWDLFGNAKTALKVTANRYVLREAIGYSTAINPAANNSTVARAWTDSNRNFFPDGDPLNPATNGELGPSPNLAFGQPIINVFYDPDWAFGWRKRPADWEFSGGIQHEVRPGVAANVSYFRRIYSNFEVDDNRAVGPADYDTYCVTAPRDPRLAGGGGSELCGLFDLNPLKVGQVDRIRTSSENFGTRKQHWNGVDLTINARVEGILLQGGLSTGTTTQDSCALRAELPETAATNPWCHTETPFLTQIKLLGAYMLPYDVQLAATFQSLPGPQISANVIYPSGQIAPSLGRQLSSARQVSINVVEPGTMYGERLNQLDLRLTKIFSVGRTRMKAMLDLYNALNSNAVLVQNNSFDAWQVPSAIVPARLAKVAFQVDF